jgi:hypothetical protein
MAEHHILSFPDGRYSIIQDRPNLVPGAVAKKKVVAAEPVEPVEVDVNWEAPGRIWWMKNGTVPIQVPIQVPPKESQRYEGMLS